MKNFYLFIVVLAQALFQPEKFVAQVEDLAFEVVRTFSEAAKHAQYHQLSTYTGKTAIDYGARYARCVIALDQLRLYGIVAQFTAVGLRPSVKVVMRRYDDQRNIRADVMHFISAYDLSYISSETDQTTTPTYIGKIAV